MHVINSDALGMSPKLSVKQESIPVGYVPSATVAVCFRGGMEQAPPRNKHPQSRHPPGADPPPAARHAGIAHTHPPAARHAGIPPPVNRMTDTCKNITFATSLWTVINV